jgi:putative redox protein
VSVEVKITYTGDLHCTAVHGPSGDQLITDAPVDNGGRGENFSPTDLVGTAMGTCMITIMGKLAERHGWDLRGTTVHVVKDMVATPLRRIGTLRIKITVPPTRTWSVEDRQRLENAAHTCPVKASLHPDVQVPVEFVYSE